MKQNKESKEECCEKCMARPGGSGGGFPPYCYNRSCPCHSTQEPMEWKSKLYEADLWTNYELDYDKLKHFISSQIKQAEEREQKRICGILRQIGTIENDDEMEKVIKIIINLTRQ